jgi:Golgi phosphoprotein 3 (GPP34)
MNAPDSLPGRLYLLAYDERRQRPVTAARVGYALRAAALADLQLSGRISDDDGTVVADRAARCADPVLAAVLADVRDRPRSWRKVVSRNDRATTRAVRDQLVAGGWIRVEARRILGLLPADRIVLRDPLLRRRLAAVVDQALRPTTAPSTVDRRDAALVALAAAAEARTVLDRRRRREHKDRITALTERSGDAAPALRAAVRAAASAG